MPGYFFDTSAVVKLYHREPGAAVVDRIVGAPGNQILISRLSGAEATSAFAIKVRTQTISRGDADVFLRQFRRDIERRDLNVFSIRESEFFGAERLVAKYAFDLRLRALDGLQLAVALALRARGLVYYFVAADKILCEVAALEGLPVVNPEESQDAR